MPAGNSLFDRYTEQLLTGLDLDDEDPSLHFIKEAESISPALARTVRFLLTLFFDILREREGVELQRLVASGGRADTLTEDGRASFLRAVGEDPARMEAVTTAYRMLLSLLSLAEGLHQRQRFAAEGMGMGRTIAALRDDGVSAEEIGAILQRVQIRLVATAHPTNIFRSIILEGRREMYALLKELYNATDETHFAQLVRSVRERLNVAAATRFGRVEKPEVLDEVRQVIGYFRNTVYDAGPRLAAQVRAEFQRVFDRSPAGLERPLLRFGSWVGGDMDGNPFVNAGVYERAVDLQRDAALELFGKALNKTSPMLSLAWTPDLDARDLLTSVRDDLTAMEQAGLDPDPLLRFVQREPFRLKIELMSRKCERARQYRLGGESGHELFAYRYMEEADADLAVLDAALRRNGFESTAEERIRPLRDRLSMFGFHLASLDLREDSVHIARAARLALRAAGHDIDPGESGPANDGDPAYRELLSREILDPKAVDLRRLTLDSETGERFFKTFDDWKFVKRIYEMLAAVRRAHEFVGPHCTTNLILTMTSRPEDVLHALLLLKSAGLFYQNLDGVWHSALDIIPLFETIDDLERSSDIMETVFADPACQAQLEARGRRQIVMLGFSDSNKDGGYFTSNWLIYLAQKRLLALGRRANQNVRFFYGRGGSIGRGGASSRHAAYSLPPDAARSGYDLTEQGEVLSRYYVVEEIADMHLETIVSAAVDKNARPDPEPPEEFLAAAARLAEHAGATYRNLIHEEPRFVAYFEDATPREVELVKIGSRPGRRRAMRTVADLRAIPWVFRWFQSRQMLPGWFGLGQGLSDLSGEVPGGEDFVKRMYADWNFFRAILQNSALALAQTNLNIGELYAGLARDQDGAQFIFERIRTEFATCEANLLHGIGSDPADFYRRNFPNLLAARLLKQPWVDSLGLLQTQLLRRYRDLEEADASEEEMDQIRKLVVSTIESVAVGLGATG